MNIEKKEIIDGFWKLGICSGDLVTMHSSLKNLGNVEGGADTVIQALLDLIGKDGTILMPAFSFPLKNEEAPIFDVEETPSCVGTISEIFRKKYASHRSIHLSHSYSALGPLAEELTSIPPDSTPCGKNSPIFRLLEKNGKILLLGVGYNSCTAFHAVEEMMDVPYMNYRINEKAQYRKDGKLFPLTSRILVRGFKYDFNFMEPYFQKEGVVIEEKIGDAAVKLLQGDKFLSSVKKQLEKDINCFFKEYSQ